MAPTRDQRASASTIAASFVAIIAVAVAVNVAVPQAWQPPLKVAIVVVLVVLARRLAGLSWDELGLARERVGAGLRLGAIAIVVIGIGIAAAVALPATRSFFESTDVADDSTARQFLMPLVVIPIGTVLFEELIFRGVLLGLALRVTSTRGAVAISAVLFGLWHVHPALADARGEGFAAGAGIVVGTVAVTTAAGVLFAWLRVRSGSLVAPACAHLATNSLAYVGAIVALHL